MDVHLFRQDSSVKQDGLEDILECGLMSEDNQRTEAITGPARRPRWSTDEKLRFSGESYAPHEMESSVARATGVRSCVS